MFNEICPPNSTQHVVKEGDTLWKLSQSYNVSVQNISDANPGINANNLQIGSILCIPANSISSTSSHTCPDRTFSYIVDSGDTLWKLSQAYGVSVQSILDVNPGINPQNLQIGSALCIPTAQIVPAPFVKTTPPTEAAPPTKTAPLASEILPVTCPKGTFRYTIQNGDTLWKLSQAYGVSVQNILDVNPGIDPQNLQIGSSLCIPTAQIVPAPFVKTTLQTETTPPTKTAPLTSEILPVTCPKGTFRYTIQNGDTLWKLSQAYGVSVQSILDVNPGIDPQNLQIGSALCIPTAQIVPAPFAKATPPTETAPPTKTAPLTSEILPVTCPKGTFRYTIQNGDTLWKLSQAYGVSVQSILDVNPGINPQNLQIGSSLCIPTAQTVPAPFVKTTPPTEAAPLISTVPLPPATPLTPTAPPTPATPQTPTVPQTTVASSRHFAYCIKKCDTICGIARKFYVSVESILKENPGINPRCLQAGTYIYVPINCCGENTWRYTVRVGDTLNRIANKLNVCPSALIAANPNIDFQHLIHCQVICIPKK
jgi:LysM repeat protein